MLQALVFLLLAMLSLAQEWTAQQFPNPRTTNGYKACKMRSLASVCDPDEGTQKLASDLNKLWNIDGQCKKAVVFVLSAHDRKLYYSGEENTGLTVADFNAIVSEQNQQLSEGKFTITLTNILKQIGGSQNGQAGTGNDASGHLGPRVPGDNGTAFTSFSFLLLLFSAIFRIL